MAPFLYKHKARPLQRQNRIDIRYTRTRPTVRPLVAATMYSHAFALLVFGILAAVTAAPTPGGHHHEHVRIHVPYHVHTVHHHHVKKIHVPVHHVEKVHVPVPVHHVEKVHVPVPYPVVEKVHVPVHVPVHHHHEKPSHEEWSGWD